MISERARIATRALFDLAFHGAGRQVQAREIAEREGTAIRYLEEVLQDLRRAGLVEAQRGPRGGYALARPPDTITLADAVVAIDGAIVKLFGGKVDGDEGAAAGGGTGAEAVGGKREATSSAPGAAGGRRGRRGRTPPRSARVSPAAKGKAAAAAVVDIPTTVWGEIGARVAVVLADVTLADLIERAQREGVPRASLTPPQMYFI